MDWLCQDFTQGSTREQTNVDIVDSVWRNLFLVLGEGLALLGQLDVVLLPVGLLIGEVLQARDVYTVVLQDLS